MIEVKITPELQESAKEILETLLREDKEYELKNGGILERTTAKEFLNEIQRIPY